MNQLTQSLQTFQQKFLPVLKNFLMSQQETADVINTLAGTMFANLCEFTLRSSKRIRPALLYYGYQCFSDHNLAEVIKIGVACELMQSFLLMHDDIMDEAETRRGGQTIHKLFAGTDPAAQRYGESMAILLGNIAGYLGIKAISATCFEEAKKARIMDLYAQICMDVNYGQALDIHPQSYDDLSENYIYNIYRYKTARYTMEFPLSCAALLADQNDSVRHQLTETGTQFGVIFQIQDDILGIFADPDAIGKSVLSDLQQGKKTLLIYKAWEKANPAQRHYLQHHYGNKQATVNEALTVREIMLETGALAYAQELMKKQARHIQMTLESLNLRITGKAFLLNLLDYYVQEEPGDNALSLPLEKIVHVEDKAVAA